MHGTDRGACGWLIGLLLAGCSTWANRGFAPAEPFPLASHLANTDRFCVPATSESAGAGTRAANVRAEAPPRLSVGQLRPGAGDGSGNVAGVHTPVVAASDALVPITLRGGNPVPADADGHEPGGAVELSSACKRESSEENPRVPAVSVCIGDGATADPPPTASGQRRSEAESSASSNAKPTVLDLEQLVGLALQQHPLLAAARLNVEAARGRLIQAGLYPNPVIGFESEDIAEGGQAGKHGPFFEQEIVLGGKLRWAQQLAAAELLATDWQALTQWYDLLTRIRLAWVELLAAESEYRLHQSYVRLVGEEEGGLVFQARRLAKVEGFRWELLRAEVELQTARARLEAAERRRQAARRELAALLGLNELPGEVPVERLSLQIPSYRWEETLPAVLSRSAELKRAEALVQRAQSEWRLIASQNIPNLRVRVRPGYSFSANTPDVKVEGGIMLPIFNRQQGNLFAAEAEIARQSRLVESLRLDLTRRLADAFGRYAAARQQAQTYAEHILPRAEESLKVMHTVFQRAKAEELRSAFLGLLEAHRAWLEAQLGYLQARRELWLAVYEIAGLLQQDHVESLP